MMLLKEKGVAAIVMKNWTCFSYKWYINASERQIKNARIIGKTFVLDIKRRAHVMSEMKVFFFSSEIFRSKKFNYAKW